MKVLIITPSADNAHLVKWAEAALAHGHSIRLVCHQPCDNPLDLPLTIIPLTLLFLPDLLMPLL